MQADQAAARAGGSRSRLGLALLALVAAAACLLLAARSDAVVGDLVVRACVADAGAAGCAPVDALGGADQVAVSPDGGSVYVVSRGDGTLSHFARDDAGGLTFRGCLAAGGASGCAPVASLARIEWVAVAPDGTAVYVAASEDNTVTHFARDAAGDLAFGSCVSRSGEGGCAPATSLERPWRVAVSPDGGSIYAVSVFYGVITHLGRDAGGVLVDRGCVGAAPQVPGPVLFGKPAADCPPIPSLEGAASLAVSPDGASVYVASRTGAVTHLARDAAGGLTFRGCLAEGLGGCSPVPSLDGAHHVTLSPDGSSVYVASEGDASVTHFARDASGRLIDRGCLAEGGRSGCTPSNALAGANSVAVSPDGASVYVASTDDSSITHFSRDAAGRLTDRGCLAKGGRSGCATVDSLGVAASVAVSPDGASVYAASPGDSSVTHLARELPGAGGPGTGTPGAGPGARPGGGGRSAIATCGGRRATIVADGRVTRGTRRADVILGRRGSDRILGLGGADLICGGAGRDVLLGGLGRDRLIGGAGADRLLGGPGLDALLGGGAADVLLGGPGRDRLIGGAGRDRQAQ